MEGGGERKTRESERRGRRWRGEEEAAEITSWVAAPKIAEPPPGCGRAGGGRGERGTEQGGGRSRRTPVPGGFEQQQEPEIPLGRTAPSAEPHGGWCRGHPRAPHLLLPCSATFCDAWGEENKLAADRGAARGGLPALGMPALLWGAPKQPPKHPAAPAERCQPPPRAAQAADRLPPSTASASLPHPAPPPRDFPLLRTPPARANSPEQQRGEGGRAGQLPSSCRKDREEPAEPIPVAIPAATEPRG